MYRKWGLSTYTKNEYKKMIINLLIKYGSLSCKEIFLKLKESIYSRKALVTTKRVARLLSEMKDQYLLIIEKKHHTRYYSLTLWRVT